METQFSEEERLDAVRSLGLIDTDPEPEFDEIVELAATICGVPMGMMTLVETDRVFHKSRFGLDMAEAPRNMSICQYTIQQDGVLIVEDTLQDARFADNIFVNAEGGVRFYAGASLRTPNGAKVGSLCVIDTQPHTLTPDQARSLAILGRQIGMRMDLRAKQLALKQLTDELRASDDKFRALADALPVETYLKDKNGRILYYNRKLADRYGVTTEEWLGKTSYDLWSKQIAEHIALEDSYVMQGNNVLESYVETPDPKGGSIFWKTIKVPCRQPNGERMLACVSVDMTEDLKRQSEMQKLQDELEIANRKLNSLSLTDELTGLWNRRALTLRLNEEAALARRNHRPLAMLLLDVDNFKLVNDTYGHPYGDTVLQQVSGAILKTKRAEDIASRYGGEEFVLLLPESDAAAAMRLAERLLETMAKTAWEKRAVTVSIGIAVLEANGTNEALIQNADTALYAAKRQGKACAVMFTGA
jgi:diguanylate cyclase (GGDEF)-like protein/PAS domain S-box-containing protein